MSSTINDFDFFMGQWRVRHRRLQERLVGCQDWEIFEGSCVAQKILGGAGNLDDNLLELPQGCYRAVTLRSFDAAANLWSIWWLDGRHPRQLDTPVTGGFADGVGTFMAEDVLAGVAIRVRFRWTATETPAPRWEQAFSVDAGSTWETNWTMQFSRGALQRL